MLGKDAQRILSQIGYMPTHTKAESPLTQARLQVLDPAALIDEYACNNPRSSASFQRTGRRTPIFR